jgi:hypothetical protein
MNRGCPWVTAGNRYVGHVGGTAGEDDLARSLTVPLPARPKGEASPGVTTCLVVHYSSECAMLVGHDQAARLGGIRMAPWVLIHRASNA